MQSDCAGCGSVVGLITSGSLMHFSLYSLEKQNISKQVSSTIVGITNEISVSNYMVKIKFNVQ